MIIKAIETRYKGYRFRSRLEARWAVFFDALGVEWQYEIEGYDVDGRRYLPDFWLPSWIPWCKEEGYGYWVEVKATDLDTKQIDLLQKLAKLSGHHTYALCGDPWPGRHSVYSFEHHHHGTPDPLFRKGFITETDNHIVIPAAGIDDHNIDLVLEVEDGHEPFCCHSEKLMYANPGVLSQAFVAARSARFEYGETPKF